MLHVYEYNLCTRVESLWLTDGWKRKKEKLQLERTSNFKGIMHAFKWGYHTVTTVYYFRIGK